MSQYTLRPCFPIADEGDLWVDEYGQEWRANGASWIRVPSPAAPAPVVVRECRIDEASEACVDQREQRAEELMQEMAHWLHRWPGGAPNEAWSALSAMRKSLLGVPVHAAPASPTHITWDAQGRRLVNGQLGAEYAAPAPDAVVLQVEPGSSPPADCGDDGVQWFCPHCNPCHGGPLCRKKGAPTPDDLVERLQQGEMQADNGYSPDAELCGEAYAEILRLRAQLAEANDRHERLQAGYGSMSQMLADRAERAEAECERLRADAERFAWWFSDNGKPPGFISEYLRGARERWTLDQWRAAIDAARKP